MDQEAIIDRWTGAGYRVFPAELVATSGGVIKKPAVKDWQALATDDPTLARALFASRPHAVVGLALGARDMVIDLDAPKSEGAPDGRKTWAGLLAIHGMGEGAPLMAATPSGGYHLYYRLPDGVATKNSVGKHGIAAGIDVRSLGGFVIAPGQAGYTIAHEGPALGAPQWAVDMNGAPRVGAAKGAVQEAPADGWDTPEALRAAAHWLKDAQGPAEGERNTRTYQVAAKLRALGVGPDTARGMVDAWLDRHAVDRESFPAQEVGVILWSVYTANNVMAAAGSELADHAILPRDEAVAAMAEMARRAGAQVDHAARRRFQRYSFDELVQIPQSPWLVDKVLRRGELAQLYGDYGTCKSFTVLDLCLHMASGEAWQGHEVAAPARVLYVAGEGVSGIRNRLKGWSQHHGRPIPETLAVVADMPAFSELDELEAFALENDAFKPDMVVLDTSARAMGALDENQGGDSNMFVQRLDALRARWGCAIMLVSHTPKSGTGGQRGPRGSNVVPAAADLVVKLERDETVADRAVVTLTVDKQKDGPLERTTLATMAGKEVRLDPETTTLVMVKVEKRERAADMDALKLRRMVDLVNDVGAEGSLDFGMGLSLDKMAELVAQKCAADEVREAFLLDDKSPLWFAHLAAVHHGLRQLHDRAVKVPIDGLDAVAELFTDSSRRKVRVFKRRSKEE